MSHLDKNTLFHSETQSSILALAKPVTSILSIRVYHRCFGKCIGNYYPSLLRDSLSKCIECVTCRVMMTPRRFIGHTHGQKENYACHWGFNSYNWPFYIKLMSDQSTNGLDETELLNKFRCLLLAPNRDCDFTDQEAADYQFDQPELDIGLRRIEQNAMQRVCSPKTSQKTKMISAATGCNKMIKLEHGKGSPSCEQIPLPRYVTPVTCKPLVLDNVINQQLVQSVADLPIFSTIEGHRVASYPIAGEPHLCLPQLLQYLKQKFTLKRLVEKFEEAGVSFLSASPKQLQGFIAVSVLPSNAATCPLIKRSDADKICLGLYEQCYKPITSILSIRVYHRCFGKCIGNYYPSLLRDSLSKCIECVTCRVMMTPRRFIGHTHGQKESNICHWGFNSYNWPFYIKLMSDQSSNNLDESELLNKFRSLLLTPNRDCDFTGQEEADYEFDQPELDVGLRRVEQNAMQRLFSSPKTSHKTKMISAATGCNKMIKLEHGKRSPTCDQIPSPRYVTPIICKPLVLEGGMNQQLVQSVADLPIFSTIEGLRVASYQMAGEPHLCLPQLLQYLKQKFTLKRLVEKFEEAGVSFLSASLKQLQGFIAVSVLPSNADACPLIKRSDADKICLELYEQCYKGNRGDILYFANSSQINRHH